MRAYIVSVVVTLVDGSTKSLHYKLKAETSFSACEEARYFLEEHPLYSEFLKFFFNAVLA